MLVRLQLDPKSPHMPRLLHANDHKVVLGAQREAADVAEHARQEPDVTRPAKLFSRCVDTLRRVAKPLSAGQREREKRERDSRERERHNRT